MSLHTLLPAGAFQLCLPGLGSWQSGPSSISAAHTLHHKMDESVALQYERNTETSNNLVPQTARKPTELGSNCLATSYRRLYCFFFAKVFKVFSRGQFLQEVLLDCFPFLFTILRVSSVGISERHLHFTYLVHKSSSSRRQINTLV